MSGREARSVDPNGIWGVALIDTAGGKRAQALSLRDVHVDALWAQRILSRMGISKGMLTMMIGGGSDNGRIWPFDKALLRIGSTSVQSDSGLYDVPRMEAYLRLFRFDAVVNLTLANLDGLESMGCDPYALFGKLQALAAESAACDRLRARDLPCWRFVSIGPLFAVESPTEPGARYDQSEWVVEEMAGELVVTALKARATPWVRMRSGVRGGVERVGADHIVYVQQ